MYNSDDNVVWATCAFLKEYKDSDRTCNKCPAEEVYLRDPCTRACRLIAQEIINVVETGNPWRKTLGELSDVRFTSFKE
jgi:hypothetical protein